MSQKTRLTSPMTTPDNIEDFINNGVDRVVEPNISNTRSQAIAFTFTQEDISRIEEQIDRAIKLGKRNKNRSAIMRMALRALEATSDEKYLGLYNKA